MNRFDFDKELNRIESRLNFSLLKPIYEKVKTIKLYDNQYSVDAAKQKKKKNQKNQFYVVVYYRLKLPVSCSKKNCLPSTITTE